MDQSIEFSSALCTQKQLAIGQDLSMISRVWFARFSLFYLMSLAGLQGTGLSWDAMKKEVAVRAGATNGVVTYWVTNTGPNAVVIKAIKPSCGCSVAKSPDLPWRLAKGDKGRIDIESDVRGKAGFSLFKTVRVETESGLIVLNYSLVIPEAMKTGDRNRNQLLAKADPKAIFRGTCVECHVTPAKGKRGKELYDTACGICHDAKHRATMVPDLRATKQAPNRLVWQHVIGFGKPGTLMPGFHNIQGGPLSETQVQSVLDFLFREYLKKPAKNE